MSGVGPIGCLLVAALKALGAAEIVCADLSPRCLAIARQMGPIGACMPRTTMLAIISRTRGISTSPAKWRGTRSRRSAAWRSLAPKAPWCRWAWAAASPISADVVDRQELNLLGSFRFVAEFALAVAWLADGVVDPLPLLSAEFASGQLAQALEFAGDKRQAAKVQLVF